MFPKEEKVKKYFYLVLVLTILNGCGTAGKVVLVSPATPEEELKDKVRETLDESKKPAEPQADNSQSRQKVVLVSPTTPEEELKDKVRETLDESKKPAEPQAGNSQSPQVQKDSGTVVNQPDESLREAHPASVGETPALRGDRLNALINLLEKKGIINKNELTEEIKRLEDQEK